MVTYSYNYPKSSCDSYMCDDGNGPTILSNYGIPGNGSVTDCRTPKTFSCYNAQSFGSSVEPRLNLGYTTLNSMQSKFSSDYQQIKCKNPQSCPNIQYASKDPRLVSPIHSGQVMTLDRPAFDSTMRLADVATSTSLDKYGQSYKSYRDIDAGYIGYYIDKSIEDPYFNPNFTIPIQTESVLYQDPMSNMKPQYYRTPITRTNVLDTSVPQDRDGCLSWMRDSLEHREDIMARQMAVRNQQRWEPRWRT